MRIRQTETAMLFFITLCAIGGAVHGQSTFPVRFPEGSLTGATGIEVARGMSVETGRHYAKNFTYTVDPLNPSVNVLDITATVDDTVVLIKTLTATTEEDSAGGGSVLEGVLRAHWDADALSGNGQWSGFVTLGSPINNSVAGSGPLELILTGGSSQLLHTVMIEIVANQDVTFEEFTDPL